MSVIIGKLISCHHRSRVRKSTAVRNGWSHKTRSHLKDRRTLGRVKDLFSVNILKVTLDLPCIVVFNGDGNIAKDSDTGASNGDGVNGVVGEHGVGVVSKLNTETDDTSGCGTTVSPGWDGVGEDQRKNGFGGVGGNDLREDVKGEFGIHIIKIGIVIWG
jgi:hypothetical protein